MNLSYKIRSYTSFDRVSFTFSFSDPDPDFQLSLHSIGSRSRFNNAKKGSTIQNNLNFNVLNSVSDLHHFDVDADPDADPDPSFQIKA
jgi:hypothetical protein